MGKIKQEVISVMVRALMGKTKKVTIVVKLAMELRCIHKFLVKEITKQLK